MLLHKGKALNAAPKILSSALTASFSSCPQARDLASYRNLQFLQAHMVFTWNIFPLVWALSALHVITPETEAYLYLAGDLSAKVSAGSWHCVLRCRR